MADIVERLRAPAYWMSGSSEGHEGENDAPLEAADEIERLRAAISLVRGETLEEAAREMLTRRERWWPDEACAAIRALKDKP